MTPISITDNYKELILQHFLLIQLFFSESLSIILHNRNFTQTHAEL